MKKLIKLCKRLDLLDLPSPDNVEKELKPYLQKLPIRLLTIIENYYGFFGKVPKTLKEIGKKLGITQSRVQSLKEKAILEIAKEIRVSKAKSGMTTKDLKSGLQGMTPIKDVDFSVRVQHILKELRIETLQEIVGRSEEILTHRLVGRKSLMEINQVLRDSNLSLKGLSLQEEVIIEILEELNISRRSMAHILGVILRNSGGNFVIQKRVKDFIKDLKDSIATLPL